MSFQTFINGLESKIKNAEASVANALANYHGLSGLLTGLQSTLSEAKAIANLVAPASVAATAINTADELVSGIEGAVNTASSNVNEDVPQ